MEIKEHSRLENILKDESNKPKKKMKLLTKATEYLRRFESSRTWLNNIKSERTKKKYCKNFFKYCVGVGLDPDELLGLKLKMIELVLMTDDERQKIRETFDERKAEKTLEKALGKSLSCKIHLQKSIPIAAGLAGGSADAAATLFGLNSLYNLKLSRKELAKIGVRIGADLPFFFYGGTCKVEGIGEKVNPIKQKISKFFVLFRPHKRIETKKMYELYDKTGKDFLSLARGICPDIKKLEKYLNNFKVKERGLSGSGPTVFCGVNSYKLAEKIASLKNFDGDIFISRPQPKALNVLKL